jgi:hypothetical protein
MMQKNSKLDPVEAMIINDKSIKENVEIEFKKNI